MTSLVTCSRHSLWIVGDGKTLANSNSVWEALVNDAKKRDCFFNAADDEGLGKVILQVKAEFDQLEDLLNQNSCIFQNARWKVCFYDWFFSFKLQFFFSLFFPFLKLVF